MHCYKLRHLLTETFTLKQSPMIITAINALTVYSLRTYLRVFGTASNLRLKVAYEERRARAWYLDLRPGLHRQTRPSALFRESSSEKVKSSSFDSLLDSFPSIFPAAPLPRMCRHQLFLRILGLRNVSWRVISQLGRVAGVFRLGCAIAEFVFILSDRERQGGREREKKGKRKRMRERRRERRREKGERENGRRRKREKERGRLNSFIYFFVELSSLLLLLLLLLLITPVGPLNTSSSPRRTLCQISFVSP